MHRSLPLFCISFLLSLVLKCNYRLRHHHHHHHAHYTDTFTSSQTPSKRQHPQPGLPSSTFFYLPKQHTFPVHVHALSFTLSPFVYFPSLYYLISPSTPSTLFCICLFCIDKKPFFFYSSALFDAHLIIARSTDKFSSLVPLPPSSFHFPALISCCAHLPNHEIPSFSFLSE